MMEKEVILSDGMSHVLEQTSLVLHVGRDEQMVPGIRSEPVPNFPNLLDFWYQFGTSFYLQIPVRCRYFRYRYPFFWDFWYSLVPSSSLIIP
ncbi:hypothetical protein Hanom_Chr11g01009781 [Helianthus anomalus]